MTVILLLELVEVVEAVGEMQGGGWVELVVKGWEWEGMFGILRFGLVRWGMVSNLVMN